MPIEIRELIIKATLSEPPYYLSKMGLLAEECHTEETHSPQQQDKELRWRQFINTQLERVLPEYLESLLGERLSEHALSDQIAHILARMKER